MQVKNLYCIKVKNRTYHFCKLIYCNTIKIEKPLRLLKLYFRFEVAGFIIFLLLIKYFLPNILHLLKISNKHIMHLKRMLNTLVQRWIEM